MKKIVLSLAVLATVALVSCNKGANGNDSDSCCDSNACTEQVEGEKAPAEGEGEVAPKDGEEAPKEGEEVKAGDEVAPAADAQETPAPEAKAE